MKKKYYKYLVIIRKQLSETDYAINSCVVWCNNKYPKLSELLEGEDSNCSTILCVQRLQPEDDEKYIDWDNVEVK